jgi:hypothetical protein
MKKMMTLVMMMVMTISAAAMSYNTARNEALFLSDKMAYELGLTNAQYEAVYEINLDYLLNVDTHADVLGFWWDVRNRDLRHVLTTWQYDRYMASGWFYRPLAWHAGSWTFAIYDRYSHGRMYMHRPAVYVSFRGGHNYRSNSFYAGHHFDKPNPPKSHGNGFNSGNHNWNHNGNHNGNSNSNAHFGGFGNGHRNVSASVNSAPSRSFGNGTSGNVASNGSNATAGRFGARR